jgi:predicted anti-sigma-YlaC factor YlaD
LSARLDGEDDPDERAEVDTHLAGCDECRRWVDEAAAVTRLVRMSVVSDPPDLIERVLAAAPEPARRRWAHGLRIALGLLGACQFLFGIAQLSLLSSAGHDHVGGGVTASHLWHESAAWNVAVGAGFGWIAIRRSRPAGMLPLLTAFVAVLLLVSANDLWTGGVDLSRMVGHGIIVAGYLIMLALSRPSLDFSDPPAGRMGSSSTWRVRFEDAPEVPAPPRLRLIREARPAPAMRYDRAA